MIKNPSQEPEPAQNRLYGHGTSNTRYCEIATTTALMHSLYRFLAHLPPFSPPSPIFVCPLLAQNVSRAYPLCEPSVSSWLAAEAGSASVDGQLACLSAIGHLIRHREGGRLYLSPEKKKNVHVDIKLSEPEHKAI